MSLYGAGLVDGYAWEPGAHANYEAGTNNLEAAICHITAGACGGDRAVGLRGYFNCYAPKSPDCGPGRTQFSYVDATDYGACEWNPRVSHLEVEKITTDEPMTGYQIESCGLWVRKLVALGVAPTYRDTPDDRIPVGAPISGFVSHRSLHENLCDEHQDYWPDNEWAAILAYALGPPTPPGPPSAGGDDFMDLVNVDFSHPALPGGRQLITFAVDGKGVLRESSMDPGAPFKLQQSDFGLLAGNKPEGPVAARVVDGVLHVWTLSPDDKQRHIYFDAAPWKDAFGVPLPPV